MDHHLGYKKRSAEYRNKKNSRSGYFKKTGKSDDDNLKLKYHEIGSRAIRQVRKRWAQLKSRSIC
ncbi:MAG: hypothetical protein CR988_00115 [Treponema sp.]|nr:MAG: hypothetical protein CR988_00115 [Treponema sp.]